MPAESNNNSKLFSAPFLILEKDGKVLLHKRKNSKMTEDMYSMVTGHIEKGETPSQCMVREAKEEANITISEDDISMVTSMYIQAPWMAVDAYAYYFYKCNKWQDEIKNMEPEKCYSLDWFDINNLPEETLPEVKQALENYQNNIIFSEFGWNNS